MVWAGSTLASVSVVVRGVMGPVSWGSQLIQHLPPFGFGKRTHRALVLCDILLGGETVDGSCCDHFFDRPSVEMTKAMMHRDGARRSPVSIAMMSIEVET